jgi:SAM-dependent methyltransferase
MAHEACGVESGIGDRIMPHRSEISEAMAPYIVARLSVHSREWREHYKKELRKWRLMLWRRRLQHLGFKVKRDQAKLREKYSSSWMKRDWPTLTPSTERVDFYNWHGEGYQARFWGMKRVHQCLLWRCIRELRPAAVLEVGAGIGLNLFALSTAFQGIRWTGVELSPGGVARAKEVQRQSELLSEIASFCSWQNAAPLAYRDVDFREGDARRLPFSDNSFDLVFSVLALEQMEEIRAAALSEIARVSAKWVCMIEPFVDFNRDPLRHACTRAKGYISLSIRELNSFGLEPVVAFDDMPQKITRGAGLVVSRKP